MIRQINCNFYLKSDVLLYFFMMHQDSVLAIMSGQNPEKNITNDINI